MDPYRLPTYFTHVPVYDPATTVLRQVALNERHVYVGDRYVHPSRMEVPVFDSALYIPAANNNLGIIYQTPVPVEIPLSLVATPRLTELFLPLYVGSYQFGRLHRQVLILWSLGRDKRRILTAVFRRKRTGLVQRIVRVFTQQLVIRGIVKSIFAPLKFSLASLHPTKLTA